MEEQGKKKIGLIGFGNMGYIIADRLLSYAKNYQLVVYDKDTNKTEKIQGLRVAKDECELIAQVETVIVAIKPQDFEHLMRGIKESVAGKLIISIAAGITTDYLQKCLGQARVIRVMPNMPSRIGKGISCVSKGKFADNTDLLSAQEIFTYLGETLVLDEGMMNAATAVSGSGPGFFFELLLANKIDLKNKHAVESFAWDVFIPQLTDAAKLLKFTEEQAKLLAVATAEGSVSLLLVTGLPPQDLISQVASKGGTTEAGLLVLRNNGSVLEAIEAAKKRAEELSLKVVMLDWLNF